MHDLIKRNSKWTGVFLGLFLPLSSIGEIDTENPAAAYTLNTLLFFIAFGLFAPPIIGLLNSATRNNWLTAPLRKINEYISIYFYAIASYFTIVISQIFALYIANVDDFRIVDAAFYLSAGIGLVCAYFLDSQFGKNSG